MRVSSPNVLPSSMQLNLPAGYIVRYFKSAFTKVQVTAEDWEAWICVQNKKRLALAYLYFDSLQSVLTESPSSLPIIDALDAELPDSAALWCAGSAQEWLQAYVVPGRLRTRSLFETFAAYVNPDEAAYVHHLVKTDTAIARFTFLLARMLHGQAHALQGVVAELWRDIRGRQVTRPLDHFSGSTERLHKLLFHHGERNWNVPSAKPCFTVTPMLLAIATSIRLSALRGFARETVPAATAARTAVSQWMRADDGKVAKKNLSRAVQVFTTVINLKDHESMSHYARGPSIFYSACVIVRLLTSLPTRADVCFDSTLTETSLGCILICPREISSISKRTKQLASLCSLTSSLTMTTLIFALGWTIRAHSVRTLARHAPATLCRSSETRQLFFTMLWLRLAVAAHGQKRMQNLQKIC